MEKEVCSFCKKQVDSLTHLVIHPLENNGISYACDECVKTVQEIRVTETGSYYLPIIKVLAEMTPGKGTINIETGEILYDYDEEPGYNTDGMSLGQKLEAAFDLKFEYEELESRVKDLKADYAQVQREILAEMAEKDLDKIQCARGSASYKVEPMPNLIDHMEFFEWVATNKKFEFLEKRCSRSAIKDMLATEGILPPGIATYQKESLSIRKKPVRK